VRRQKMVEINSASCNLLGQVVHDWGFMSTEWDGLMKDGNERANHYIMTIS
jgi:hypothetical protein